MHRGKGMKFVGDSRVPAERKPNIPKDYSEYPGKTEAFWPNFLLKEWMIGSIFLVGYLILTIVHESPLERQADPTDASYVPLPDWYFLFLYQLLKYKYAAGDFVLLGTVVIPGLAFGALLLAPWLDRVPHRRPLKRPVPTAMMLLALSGIIFLTWESVSLHNWEQAKAQGQIAKVELDTEAEGYKILSDNTCLSCHGNNLEGGANAPALYDSEMSAEEIMKIAVEGSENGNMPPGIFKGTDEELQILADYIVNIEE
jgi:menaquinol-cytochrome c reductase cytochrome b/c subunit